MKILRLLQIFGAFLAIGAPLASATEAKPNIVFILADDMGYECVGANGAESYKTPALDAMAREGMRFNHCHSQPICTPSRVQVMTGRYNSRNYTRFGHLDPKETTFAQILRDAGYATCITGKWQLEGGLDQPRHFGFDQYALWQLTRRPNRYPNPGLEIEGQEVNFRDGQYGPDIVSDYACDFIEQHQDKPFLLYYPMILPHFPFEPTPDSSDWDPKARRDDLQEKGGHGNREYFADMVAYTDKLVGKILAKLDELDLRENTLVIFTGDNGTMTGITSILNGKPYPGGKGQTTSNASHVPLIASWPGRIPQGAVCDNLIDFSDFLPTFLEVAGTPLPEGLEIDGRSFWPQLSGASGNPRQWIYFWYYRSGKEGEKWNGRWGGEWARTKQYKYELKSGFFDVTQPDEDLSIEESRLTPQQREIRDELRSVVLRYQRQSDR